jgi:hypothetical protein
MRLVDAIRRIWTLAGWTAEYISQVGAGRQHQH